MKETFAIKDESIHWFHGEQVPEGFYWVLLDARSNARPGVEAHLKDLWKGAILEGGSKVLKPSKSRVPWQGSSFVINGQEFYYSLKLKCFYNLEDAEKFVEEGKEESVYTAQYDWRFLVKDSHFMNREILFVKEVPAKIQGIQYDHLWFEEVSSTFTLPVLQPKEQTEQQRIAQRQVDLNKARISKLEKELKDLRELQKLLKGLR